MTTTDAAPTPAAAVARYRRGAELLGYGIAGLGAADLDARPVQGTWTIREIAVHLLESDLIGADRMKRVASMDRPLIIGYDESAFMRNLSPHLVDVAKAAEIFRSHRELFSVVLGALPESAWSRWGVHNERGKVSLMDLAIGYSDHVDHHLRHLYRKRGLLNRAIAERYSSTP